MEAHGHKVLRLPPYHPELNPIENIWATVKNWVASHNTTFKLCDVEALARQKFSQMGSADWKNICERVVKLEQKLYSDEHNMDSNLESLQFIVNTESSDDDLPCSCDSDESD